MPPPFQYKLQTLKKFHGRRFERSEQDAAIFERQRKVSLLVFVRFGEIQDLLLGTYFDGSWSTRRDGLSQGGLVQFVVTRSAAEPGAPTLSVIIDWACKKVTRVFRASLDVEAQAGVIAVDALEFAKLFFVGVFLPNVSLQNERIWRWVKLAKKASRLRCQKIIV